MLKPVDLLICLKISTRNGGTFGYEGLANDLGIGLGSAHRSVKRAVEAGLLTSELVIRTSALVEFVICGARYAFYVKPGEMTRGLPTAHAAPPLSYQISSGNDVPVWPDSEGLTRGYAVAPLHKNVPRAAMRDPELYELLALFDALRIGRARERELAKVELTRRLSER